MQPQPPRPTLFPYTTLFRSGTAPPNSQIFAPIPLVLGLTPFKRTATRGWFPSFRYTPAGGRARSEEHTSELQSRQYLVCRLLLEKKKRKHLTKIVLLLKHHM